jgi:copper chaperone CopZ
MSCEPKVARALEGLEGVKNANASYPEKKAAVIYDSVSVTTEQMQMALFKAGYVASFGDLRKKSMLGPLLERKSEFQRDDLVCFCFGHTRNDIEKDYIENSQSTILTKIVSEKRSGGCDCANKNPKGR